MSHPAAPVAEELLRTPAPPPIKRDSTTTTHGRDVATPGTDIVIHLNRINGQGFAINPDLIMRAESTPDTVITLVDGTKYVVEESVDVLSERVRRYRASVTALAQQMVYGIAEASQDGDVTPLSTRRPRS